MTGPARLTVTGATPLPNLLCGFETFNLRVYGAVCESE